MALTFTSEIKPEDYEGIIALMRSYREFQRTHEHGHLPVFDSIPNWDLEKFLKKPNWKFLKAIDEKKTIVGFCAWREAPQRERLATVEILVSTNHKIGEKTYQEFERRCKNDVIYYNLSKRMTDYTPFLDKYPQYIYLLSGEKELRLCFIARTEAGHRAVKRRMKQWRQRKDIRTVLTESQREGVSHGEIVTLREYG